MDYGYARVSTSEQNTAVQVDQLTFAGCGTVYEEKASGADNTRPILAHIMSVITTGDTLTVCKLDRIARSTSHLLSVIDTLTARGAAFRVLNLSLDTSTPTGKLMLTMLGAVATFEREILLERQAEGIARARAEGVYANKPRPALAQVDRVMALKRDGHTNQAIADTCSIGVASVYRILAIQRTTPVEQTSDPVDTGKWREPELPPVNDPVAVWRAKYGGGAA